MVADWHALMQRQHLGKCLEDIGYILCDSRYFSGSLEISQVSKHRIFCDISVNGGNRADSKTADGVRQSSADEPDMTGYAFKHVLIKVGVARVCNDFAEDVDESLQNVDIVPEESPLHRDDNSHNAWERYSSGTKT